MNRGLTVNKAVSATGAGEGSGEPGADGREVELQKSATHVQWRYAGDVSWINLVALTEITGAAGAAGAQGIQGETGPQGLQGIQGVAGNDGAAGSNGAAGANGSDGTDGREVELQKTATHIQWRYTGDAGWTNLVLLTDIKGDTGAQGIQGIQGVAGNDGAAGPQGIQGIPGTNGAQGEQGPQGIQGPAGPQGETGSQGIQGIQGIQGVKGDTGDTGPQGPAGTASYHLVATLASDQATGANVTPVTLSGLQFSYAANSMYRIWFMGRVQPTAATTGCGFQFDLSSAVTSIDVMFDHQLANTGTITGGHSIADDASVGVSSGMPGTSTYPIRGEGLLRTGANAGTAQLRFRSETTAVTTAKAGLTLVVEKIA